MPYKVFLVEDEIMTREGIRDSVEWASAGYQFCGDAPDGEIALPLIREQQPEVVITDIKMPFMDGLQLSRVLRATMPTTKIIILSGHDEFKYAQEAIKAGVTEYLLKPLSAQELLAALARVGRQIAHEQQANAQLAALQAHVSGQQSLLRERYLLDLLAGNLAPSEIIDKCQQLGIELAAPWYVPLLVRLEIVPDQFDLLQRLEATVTRILEGVPGAIWCKYDLTSTAVILRGESVDRLQYAAQKLARELGEQADQIVTAIGGPTDRVDMLAQSFAQTATHASVMSPRQPARPAGDLRAMIKPGTAVLEQLLKSGVKADIPRTLDAYLQPLGEAGANGRIQIEYVLTDALLTVANMLRDLGAEPAAVVPEVGAIETLLERVATCEQLRPVVASALDRTIEYRDRQTHHQHTVIARARAYIEAHYADPNISLNTVAAYVTLSPTYFSATFGREVGETFVEYLTGVRVRRATELLRTTSLTFSEIAARVGYQNPRYFHAVFRKATGQSPMVFRRRV